MTAAVAQPTGVVVGACATRLWGMDGTERARRTLRKLGIAISETLPTSGTVVLVRADWVVDSALIGLMKSEAPGARLVARDGDAATLLAVYVDAADAQAARDALLAPGGTAEAPLPQFREIAYDPKSPSIYLHKLRKRLKPVVMPLTPKTVPAAEKATFHGAYKDVTDIVTKYVWPFPARHATRWCSEHGVSPNMVTMLGLVLVFAAMGMFYEGWFAAGLAAAWIMTFLDTVDGKLARCTLTFTRFGDVFDHGIDLISPPFWWWAWHVGCIHAGVSYPLAELSLIVVLGGYVVLRLQEGVFKALFGMHIHVWRRWDSVFRLIVARRNPILVILTVAVALGQPGWGMTISAAWTAVSVVVHFVQLTQAISARRTQPVVTWLAE